MKVRKKQPIVEAVQYPGAIQAWDKEEWLPMEAANGIHGVNTRRGWETLRTGMWVLKSAKLNIYRVMTDKEFRASYEVVEDTCPAAKPKDASRFGKAPLRIEDPNLEWKDWDPDKCGLTKAAAMALLESKNTPHLPIGKPRSSTLADFIGSVSMAGIFLVWVYMAFNDGWGG